MKKLIRFKKIFAVIAVVCMVFAIGMGNSKRGRKRHRLKAQPQQQTLPALKHWQRQSASDLQPQQAQSAGCCNCKGFRRNFPPARSRRKNPHKLNAWFGVYRNSYYLRIDYCNFDYIRSVRRQ